MTDDVRRDIKQGAHDAAWGILWLALVVGWFLNLFKLWDVTTIGEAAVRVLGVIIPPLGAIVGYL
jgi:hypothetical protein